MAGFWSGLVEGQKARASQDMTLAKIAEWNRLKDLREKQSQFDMADLDSKMQMLPVETQAAIAKNQAIMQELPSQLSLNQLKRGAEGLQAADTLNNFAADQALKRKTNQLAYDQAAQKPVNKGVFNADLGGFVYEPTAQNPNGVFVPVNGAKKPVQADAAQASRVRDANDALGIIGEATPLLNDATGSALGAGVDWAANFFGKTTKGSEATAKLKVLSGLLVSKMPKMSGPQSDKDVLLYREMAGQIGDPTIPAAQKQAALETLKTIQEKYAGVEKQDELSVGAVQDGYVYLGGDPSSPNSWKKSGAK